MSEINYHELLEMKAGSLKGKTFLKFEHERISYQEADDRANQVAHGPLKLGALEEL